jgi:hypothetical protein
LNQIAALKRQYLIQYRPESECDVSELGGIHRMLGTGKNGEKFVKVAVIFPVWIYILKRIM